MGEEQLQLQASEAQRLRASVALRRQRQREEVESRREMLQEGVAFERQSKLLWQEGLGPRV